MEMSATIINLNASTGQLPKRKLADRLIVLCAFDRDEEGVLQAAFEPREMQSERRAITFARELTYRHAGVIAWAREANLALGDYGPPQVLYQAGDVPELD